jgi:hypothetical protein
MLQGRANFFMDDTGLGSTVFFCFDIFNVLNVLKMGFQSGHQSLFSNRFNDPINFTVCQHSSGVGADIPNISTWVCDIFWHVRFETGVPSKNDNGTHFII